MSALVDCPFCGDKGAYSFYSKSNDYSECGEGWYACCGNCTASVGPFDSEDTAEQEWNRRHAATKMLPVVIDIYSEGYNAGAADKKEQCRMAILAEASYGPDGCTEDMISTNNALAAVSDA